MPLATRTQRRVKSKRFVGFCPHCCSRTPQRLIHTQQYRDLQYGDGGAVSECADIYSYFVVECGGCGQILLYHDTSNTTVSAFVNCVMLFPADGSLHESIPARIRLIYSEGFRIRIVSPNLYAVQIRKALEVVAEDRASKGGTLEHKLRDLATRGELPPVLAAASDVLRVLGNIGAHDDALRPEQVIMIDEFFRAVVGYLYVAPSRLTEYQARSAKVWARSPN
jgi:hypothetical protein